MYNEKSGSFFSKTPSTVISGKWRTPAEWARSKGNMKCGDIMKIFIKVERTTLLKI